MARYAPRSDGERYFALLKLDNVNFESPEAVQAIESISTI